MTSLDQGLTADFTYGFYSFSLYQPSNCHAFCKLSLSPATTSSRVLSIDSSLVFSNYSDFGSAVVIPAILFLLVAHQPCIYTTLKWARSPSPHIRASYSVRGELSNELGPVKILHNLFGPALLCLNLRLRQRVLFMSEAKNRWLYGPLQLFNALCFRHFSVRIVASA